MDRSEFLNAMAALVTGAVIGCDSETEDLSTTGAGGGSATTSANASTTTTGNGGATSSTAAGTGGAEPGSCRIAVDAQITCRTDHSLIIPPEDIEAGVTKTYDIQGTNPTHGHDVTVTAEMFTQLKMGVTVEIFVPSSFQPHTVFISCAGLDPHALDEQDCN